jgi:hypothetical protein
MKFFDGKLALLAVVSVALGGCQGVIWGNVTVLVVTVGLFFGTLRLGRQAPQARVAGVSSATESVHSTVARRK